MSDWIKDDKILWSQPFEDEWWSTKDVGSMEYYGDPQVAIDWAIEWFKKHPEYLK